MHKRIQCCITNGNTVYYKVPHTFKMSEKHQDPYFRSDELEIVYILAGSAYCTSRKMIIQYLI